MKKTLFILILAGLSALGYSQMPGGLVQIGGTSKVDSVPWAKIQNKPTTDVTAFSDYLYGTGNTTNGDKAFTGGGYYNTNTQQYGFISGATNSVTSTIKRGLYGIGGTAVGVNNYVTNRYGTAMGTGAYVDGNIGISIGNNNICTQNDATAYGNQTVNGRITFPVESYGTQDAGDGLGTRYYVNIDESYGDLTALFPNKLVPTDSLTNRYGAGTQIDTAGNVYASGLTKYTDINFAAHPYIYLRSASEGDKVITLIRKCIYSAATGTKIYLNATSNPLSGNPTFIGSSYAPTLPFRKYGTGGNGGFTSGIYANAWGYASTAIGDNVKALGQGSFATNYYSKAIGTYSSAFNYYTLASGNNSVSFGNTTVSSGIAALSSGTHSISSGNYAASFNYYTTAAGAYSNTFGDHTKATGSGSSSDGTYCVSSANYAKSWGSVDSAKAVNSTAWGDHTKASGTGSNSSGYYTTASGNYSQSHNNGTLASAADANAWNTSTVAGAASSNAFGVDSKTSQVGEIAQSSAKFVNDGDAQVSTYTKKFTFTGAGWYEITWFNVVDTVSVYNYDLKVIFKDITQGDAEYGHAACYTFTGAFTTWGPAGTNYTDLGTPTRVLLGENFTAGNQTTIAPMMAHYGLLAGSTKVDLRFDGIAGHKYDILVSVRLVNLSTKYHAVP